MNVDFNSYFLVSVVDEGVHTSIHISSLLRYMNMNTKDFFYCKGDDFWDIWGQNLTPLDQLTVNDQ